MKCVQCGFCDSAVIDSRESEDGGSIRRRRECASCHCRFTTYERLEAPRLMVVKKDGGRELFERSKLSVGIYKAFHKRPITAMEIEKFIDDVERDIYEEGREEIGSTEIGELLMQKLEKIDHVAYIRFAAVYREFRNLSDFSSEITNVMSRNKTSPAEV